MQHLFSDDCQVMLKSQSKSKTKKRRFFSRFWFFFHEYWVAMTKKASKCCMRCTMQLYYYPNMFTFTIFNDYDRCIIWIRAHWFNLFYSGRCLKSDITLAYTMFFERDVLKMMLHCTYYSVADSNDLHQNFIHILILCRISCQREILTKTKLKPRINLLFLSIERSMNR